jgi:hypothetical protein
MVRGPVDLRNDIFRRAGKLARLFGAWLMGGNVIWFLAALTCLPIGLIASWGFEGEWSAGSAMISGLVIAPVGFVLSVILFAVGQHVVDERHWRGGRRRGIATVHDLRSGHTNSDSATQELTCRLEIVVPGVIPRRADDRAEIGPLDAPRFVEGASFACEACTGLSDRVRVWLFADAHTGELTGRYRDFQPVRAPRK